MHVLVAVLVLVALVNLSSDKTWSSDVVLRLTAQSADLALDPTVDLPQEDPVRRLATETENTLSDAVVQPAAEELGVSEDDLRRSLGVLASEDADVFVITGKGPTAERAQQVARVVSDTQVRVSQERARARLESAAQALTTQVEAAQDAATAPAADAATRAAASDLLRTLTSRYSQLLAQRDIRQPSVETVTAATFPESPDGLRLPQALLLGALAGLLLGAALAYLRDTTNRRVTGEEALSEAFPCVPVLALPAADSRAPASPARAEALRRIQVTAVRGTRSTVLVTALTSADDVSEMLYDLGGELADGGVRTILVDAQTGGDGVTRRLGLSAEPGLTQLLHETGHGEDAPQTVVGRASKALRDVGPGLRVLPGGWDTGTVLPLRGPVMSRLLQELSDEADVVLVSSSALDTTDGLTLAGIVDDVVAVVSVGVRGVLTSSVRRVVNDLSLMGVRPRLLVALETTRQARRRPVAPAGSAEVVRQEARPAAS